MWTGAMKKSRRGIPSRREDKDTDGKVGMHGDGEG